MPDSSRREKLHWYRCMEAIWMNAGVIGGLAIIAGGLSIAIGVLGGPRQLVGLWVGALALLFAAYILIAGFRAGIGVGRDGVRVRSMWGWGRWIPWPDIERFAVIRRRVPRGGQMAVIAVIFVESRKPSLVYACSREPWGRSWTRTNLKMSALQNALENAREGTASALS
jgi:hypothetical protein